MEQQIKELLVSDSNWQHIDNQLVGVWEVADFQTLRGLVAAISDLAEELNHHPTVTYGYNTLKIETTTHDAGNVVTEKDLFLAHRINELLEK